MEERVFVLLLGGGEVFDSAAPSNPHKNQLSTKTEGDMDECFD